MASFDVIDPTSAQTIATISETSAEQIAHAGERLRAAHLLWTRMSHAQRAKYMRRVRRAFYQRRAELVDAAIRETGKPEVEILTAGVLAVFDLFDYFEAQTPKVLADEPLRLNPVNYPKKRAYIHHAPHGIVGIVASWNYPIALSMRAIIPALFAGNCVVFKPSKQAALTGAIIGEVFKENLPGGVFETVQGGRGPTQAVTRLADKLQFIGSGGTGRALAKLAADKMIPGSFELSGVDAAIVLPDCNIERTVEGIVWGAFTNTGQNCASIERLLVHRDIADTFIAKLIGRVRALRLREDVGPLRSEAQRQIVQAHVQDALDRGAELLCGGKAVNPGFFFEPTVFKVDSHDGLALTEETFGPTLPILVFDDEQQAITWANDVPFGLTASVWSRDTKSAERLLADLDVGVAMVNNASFTAAIPSAPWGGVKGTGYGVTNSKYILLEMTHPKMVLIDSSTARELWWYPYNTRLRALLEAMIDMKGGRLTRAASVVPNMLKRWS